MFYNQPLNIQCLSKTIDDKLSIITLRIMIIENINWNTDAVISFESFGALKLREFQGPQIL